MYGSCIQKEQSIAGNMGVQPYFAGRTSDGVRATMIEIATKELL